ncbi:OTU domain-containing protein 5 [Nematostella vectensis]|uniref:OTU domain-containing protein 5 n=1 Tax=Nematostella vectensis TaxID=45351 RepID=UPI0020773E72|nr:OTU domain-containing protein 5 [Nematostella vectensis]
MTILPKKKHSETKKPETNTSNEARGRIRGAQNWSSPQERSWTSEEYGGEESYRSGNFEARESSDASSGSKRRHRASPHRHKYHERHSEETGYNSSDEHDGQNLEVATDEMERQFEQALKEKKGFTIKRMAEDGACLFRSVADQVYGDQEMHGVVRKHCMDYMLKNMDYFSQYVTEDFRSYIRRKRDNHCHGNHVEMQALSEMYNRTIEVYQYSIEPINIFHSSHKTDNEPIRLSYHNNIHYNSVINPNKPSVGVGLGISGYKPWNVLVNDAFKQSEEWHIEQQMLEDKLRATDWEATDEAMEEAVARESYLDWLQDSEKRARGARAATWPGATASSSSTSTSTESKRPTSPHHRERDRDPENAPPSKSPRHSPASTPTSSWHDLPGPSLPDNSPSVASTSTSGASSVVGSNMGIIEPRPGCSTHISNPPSPQGAEGGATPVMPNYLDFIPKSGYGLSEWEDERILAVVLAESQKDYLASLKKSKKEKSPEPGTHSS